MGHWMFNCREVSKMVSRSMDERLPFHTRMAIGIHLLMCKFCSRAKKQLQFIRDNIQLYDTQIESLELPLEMDSETKARIKDALRKHQASS